jgi:hypothetical protein
MGNCLSTSDEDAGAKENSEMIDRMLQEDGKRWQQECKILLLGKSPRAVRFL